MPMNANGKNKCGAGERHMPHCKSNENAMDANATAKINRARFLIVSPRPKR